MNPPSSRHQTWGRGRFDGAFSTPHSSRDDMKCVHSWCTERVWGKVGKSGKKWEKVGKSCQKLEKVVKSGKKLGKMVKSGEKWEKVGKSREK